MIHTVNHNKPNSVGQEFNDDTRMRFITESGDAFTVHLENGHLIINKISERGPDQITIYPNVGNQIRIN